MVQRKANLDSYEEELAEREQALGGALKEAKDATAIAEAAKKELEEKNPRESFWTSELPVPRSAVAVSAAAGSTVLPLAGERSLTGNSSLGGVVEADGTSGPASGRS